MVKVLFSRKYLNYLAIFSIILLNSCSTTKKVPYFQDITANGGSDSQSATIFKGLTIDSDDILSISLVTVDPTTGMPVNQLAAQVVNGNVVAAVNTAGSSTSAASGFLVDKNGEVDLSIIGKVKVAGLTTYEARDLLKTKAAVFYKDPNVQVRYANFKVTVLGEVAKPSSYILPNEKVSVLDALGMAGDLTIFGKRENVLLIRDQDGKKEFARLDLNSSRIFDSPYYYLKQNDVIYVEPNKGKAASLNQARTQTFAIIGTALSVLIVLFSRI